MSEWRPIGTAPKDGTRILVAWPDKSVSIAWWTTNPRLDPNEFGRPNVELLAAMQKHGWQTSHFIDHAEMDDFDISKPENQPTRWQPVPEPPK